MKPRTNSAIAMRGFLTFVLLLLVAAIAAGFYFGVEQIKMYAIEVSHATTDSNASGKQFEELEKLKKELADRQNLVTKANSLFSTEADYQSKAQADVQRYASQYGLTITRTDFSPDRTGLAADTTAKAFAVTLRAPASYENLLKFMNAIEGNLPKMQIEKIDLKRTGSATTVDPGTITITIATRM